MNKSEWLDYEETQWRSLAKKGLDGKKQAIIRIEEILAGDSSSVWLLLRITRFFKDIGRIDLALRSLVSSRLDRDERGESELKKELRIIIGSIHDKEAKISATRILARNDLFKSLSFERSAVDLYMSRQPRKSAIVFAMAFKDKEIDRISLTVWIQLVSQLSVYEQRVHLMQIRDVVRSQENVTLFSAAMTLSVMCGRIDLVSSYFVNPVLGLLSRWEYLLWFNRMPLDKSVERKLLNSLEFFVDQKLNECDFRWLFQYALLLQKQVSVKKALAAFRVVCKLDAGLAQLSQPLAEALGAWEHRTPRWHQSGICRATRTTNEFTKSDKVICVFFSGWNGALGHIPDWLLINVLKEQRYGVVILRDPTNSWFMGDTGELDCHWEHEVESIHKATSAAGQKMIFIGSSITGLSAMQYGLRFKPVAIINFAGPLNASRSIDNGEAWTTKKGRKQDLREHLLERKFPDTLLCLRRLENERTRLFYLYGQDNQTDATNALIYDRYNNCITMGLPGVATHAVSNYSINNGILIGLLEKTVSSKIDIGGS